MARIENWRETLKGLALTIASLAFASFLMFTIRSHVSVATAALVLVIPVLWGVVVGGFRVGLVGMIFGFLIYDFVFIPPYYTLSVGANQNWIALFVYVIVVFIVSRLVSNLKDARSYAQARESATRQLFELSELLIGDKKLNELLRTIVNIIQMTFKFDSVALLLQENNKLKIMASAGKELTPGELSQIVPASPIPIALNWTDTKLSTFKSLALTARGKPVGILIMRLSPASTFDLDMLSTFANNAALVIEQAQVGEQLLHTERLEETDRWRRALLGSISHDLRTPLASIKTSASNLADESINLNSSQAQELLNTIVSQTDRLTRLVVNLLDMSRIEAGVLKPNLEVTEMSELIGEGIRALGIPELNDRLVTNIENKELYVKVDHLLISQVIANIIENAIRYSPPDAPINIDITQSGNLVTTSVSDAGPGVPEELNEQVFEMFHKDTQGGRAGLGLAIAKAFVDAHGGTIAISKSAQGGAKFYFNLPCLSIEESDFLDDQAITH